MAATPGRNAARRNCFRGLKDYLLNIIDEDGVYLAGKMAESN